MFNKINRTTRQDPHPGLIIASHHFSEPYPLVNEIDLLSLVTIDLLNQFVYPTFTGYGKFTITFTLKRSYGEEIAFTLGPAIPLTYQDCNLIPMSDVYANIYRCIKKYDEIYDGDCIVRVMIRVYLDGKKKDCPAISYDERDRILSSIIQAGLSETEPLKARNMQYQTLMIDDVHKPYAAGLLMIRPADEINDHIMIDTYFSEDYSIILDSFEERSEKVRWDFPP
ncbi:hypothetical protein VNO77_49267 [Canavalia gladiata]|uniref:Uncharacterized protein n=1 Tax=Canavalia gladiata TaxID=3824 RepID=A0AAN9PFU0_CANGL